MILTAKSFSRAYKMHVFLLLIGLCLGIASCAAPPPVVPERGAAIAVWSVEDLSPASARQDWGDILSDQIIETIKRRGAYEVVERKRLVMALEELRLGTTAVVDESTRLRLGKLLGARWMVFGGYLAAGDHMRLDLRLVEVETGKVKKAVQKTTSSKDLNDWISSVRRAAEELF